MNDNHVRSATFVRIIDGDTFKARLALAQKVDPVPYLEASIRVAGWNAAELNEAEGPYLRAQFEEILTGAKSITVQIVGMSFQRIVATVFVDGYRFDGILSKTLARVRQTNRVPNRAVPWRSDKPARDIEGDQHRFGLSPHRNLLSGIK